MERTKKTLVPLLLGAVLLSNALFAQTNFSGFNYQAVVRDANGDPLPDQNVGVQLVISCGSLQPYVEDHAVTTDAHGLMDLVIGEGTPVFGSAPFNTIDWSGCGTWTWNVTVSMDITGGTNYSLVGSQQMKAVPFALNALSTTNQPPTGWALQGSDLLNTNTGNVGIGTSIPSAKLDVEGSFRLKDGTEGTGKVLTSDANGLASWAVPFAAGEGWALNGSHLSNTNNGNVGIGTTLPTHKLEVRTDIQGIAQTSADGTISIGTYVSNALGAYIQTNTNDPLKFTTNNGLEQMTLTTDGDVGIGIATPTGRLQVAAPYDHGTTLNLLQSTNSWGSPALFNAHRYIQTNYAGNPAEFKQFNVGGGGVSIGYSNVPIYGSADALYVNGRVGIGTTAPAASFEVNGYTKLGSDAPAIKYKKITGNFPGNVGAYFYVYHGLDPSKILGVDMIVTAANARWLPHSTYSGFTYEVNVYADGANQYLVIECGPSATGLVNAPYTVLITYEQ